MSGTMYCPPGIPACRVLRVIIVLARGIEPTLRYLDSVTGEDVTELETSDSLELVATYSGDFEVRRFQANWEIDSGDVRGENVRVCTWHCVKLAAGAPSADWLGPDFGVVAEGFEDMWTATRTYFSNRLKLDRIKAYKAGPDIEPPQPPVYELDITDTGGTGGDMMPPQVALTVTQRAGTHRHWGRFYYPNPLASATDLYGRPDVAFTTALANAADTWVEAMRTAGVPLVVYRRELEPRFSAAAKRLNLEEPDLPARTASAWTVETLAVDDVWDVIRRRRYNGPTLRTLRGVGT